MGRDHYKKVYSASWPHDVYLLNFTGLVPKLLRVYSAGLLNYYNYVIEDSKRFLYACTLVLNLLI